MARLRSNLAVSGLLITILLAGFTLFSKSQRLTASKDSSTPVPSPTETVALPSDKKVAPTSRQENAALSYQTQAQKQATLEEDGDLRPLTTPEVVNLSTKIVVARCLAINVKEVSAGNIFTFSEFEALQVLKGEKSGNKFTLRLYGGRLGNVEINGSSMPQFAPGEEVVLSLGRDNLDGYPTIFPQGTFRIALDPQSHQRVVVTKPRGLPIFSAKNNQPYAASSGMIPLDDFLFSLSKLINRK